MYAGRFRGGTQRLGFFDDVLPLQGVLPESPSIAPLGCGQLGGVGTDEFGTTVPVQRNSIVLFGIGDKGKVLRVRGQGGTLGVRSGANELTPARGVTRIRVFVVKGICIRETTRLLGAAKREAQGRRGRRRGRGCHLSVSRDERRREAQARHTRATQPEMKFCKAESAYTCFRFLIWKV